MRCAPAVLAAFAILTASAGAQGPAAQSNTTTGTVRSRAGLPSQRHNAIIFIADGLRHDSVNAMDAPTLLELRRRGVELANSHAVFPTVTTTNAAAIATGHAPGDTGDFSNAVYLGFRIFEHGNFNQRAGTPVPFLENDAVLGDVDAHFPGGNFLNEVSVLALARAQGFNTAAIGKLGPAAIQDVIQVRAVDGGFSVPATVILDDSTGSPDEGVPVSGALKQAIAAAGLPPAPPPRRQAAGDLATPGTLEPNRAQQQWLVDATTRVVLPSFVASGKPFVLVFWSRDPDGTQHNQGDSLNRLEPGINGPTSRAAIANADADLKQILDYVKSTPQLATTTDVFVTSDHGFATITKHQLDAQGHATRSYAATAIRYSRPDGELDVNAGSLPPGFLAIDLAHGLGEPLFDLDTLVRTDGRTHYQRVEPAKVATLASRRNPAQGNALIGGSGELDASDARLIVAANGGSDLIYVPSRDRALVARVVEILARQDYIGAIFAESSFGRVPGALPLSAIALEGTATMRRPQIVVSFRSFLRKPGDLLSAVQIADTPLQEGQGMHGSLARDNTFNNMAVWGPDFREGFRDLLPASNVDIAPTLAHVLGLKLPAGGALRGRVLLETLRGGQNGGAAQARPGTEVSPAAASGRATHLEYQELGGQRYLDAAAFK